MEHREAIEYRGITIVKESDRYFTLGSFYITLEDARFKIDRYWDDEENDDWRHPL